MSRFSNLLTYSWSSSIDDNSIEINAYGRDVEEARHEVLAILAEIARIKPQYLALEKEGNECAAKSVKKAFVATIPEPAPKNWAQVVGDAEKKTRSFGKIREDQRPLTAQIPADFFNGAFSASTFDYTPDQVVGEDCGEDCGMGKQTLSDFIRTTEPTCEGPVRMVSFRSCLNG
jgi:hypothetical protein